MLTADEFFTLIDVNACVVVFSQLETTFASTFISKWLINAQLTADMWTHSTFIDSAFALQSIVRLVFTRHFVTAERYDVEALSVAAFDFVRISTARLGHRSARCVIFIRMIPTVELPVALLVTRDALLMVGAREVSFIVACCIFTPDGFI